MSRLQLRPGARRSIRAIFFDFDGVLTRDKTGSLTTLRYLSGATGVEFAKLQDAFRDHNDDLNLGRASHADIWPAVCRKLGTQIDIGLLPTAFESTPFNEGMLRIAVELKRHYSVGIITDNKADRIRHLKIFAKLPMVFDPIVVSSEVGSNKDSPHMFQTALDHAGVNARQSIFIDNTESNLITPRALGMNVIHFDDEANDLNALRVTLKDSYGIAVTGDA